MKMSVLRILIGLTGGVILLLALLPVFLPPLVQSIAEAKLAECGFPARTQMNLNYIWNKGPELAGSFLLKREDSPGEASADFGVGLGCWHARLRIPQTELTETDPAVSRLLEAHLPKGVSNLTFRASLFLEASAERTLRRPFLAWSAKMPVRISPASLIKDDRPISVGGLAVTFGASGIADHLDISPMFLRAESVDIGNFSLTNLTAAVRATEKSLLVTEAKARTCGGKVSLYALFLDPKTLNAGFTLFMDDVEAGEILGHFKGFRGEASGRLHGKLRLFLKEGGKSLRFSDAFLYSTPGETGKLKMSDAGVVTDNLALAGINEDSRQNVANALADLDYSVLKLDLKRGADDSATLSVHLNGTATRDNLTVPVNLNINFNGKLEQLVNTGLSFSEHLKGKKQ